MTAPIGVGVIGMGFMGATHARAYVAAAAAGSPCVLRAVCDRDADRRSGKASGAGNIRSGADDRPLFNPAEVSGYSNAADLLADPAIDLVSICTHTDTHVDLAIRALDAGKHVLVEKPVGLRSEEVARLVERAGRTGRLCVPAMCMRHWPGWTDLARLIASGEHGRVVHARFERLGAPPAWAADFYRDEARCGAAVFDLHVHDADFAMSLFGRPASVSSIGDSRHIATQMRYPGGPAVTTEGGWLNDPSYSFRMAFTVEFERAVAVYDSSRGPAMTLHAGGQARPVDLPELTGYDLQARAVVRAIAAGGDASGLPTTAEALAVTRLIEAERASAEAGSAVTIDW